MSDFGDESGEKLFDWMLRVGQDEAGYVLLSQAERLSNAFRNSRGQFMSASDRTEDPDIKWAKLKLEEFWDLPEYNTIREIISEKLDRESIEHTYYADEYGQDFLIFKICDAPLVAKAFEDLEKQTNVALDKALESRGLTREQARDMEPLDERVTVARASSKAIEAARENLHTLDLIQGREK